MNGFSRRSFLAGAGALVAASALPGSATEKVSVSRLRSPFRIAVITDEITQDFDHACAIAANEFGMEWVEIRGLWDKNALKLTSAEIAEAKRIVDRYHLRVTDIASPLFKVDWPGAPISKFGPKRDLFNADFTFKEQAEVLEKSIELAKAFDTDRVRGFDFWRLDGPAPHRKAINAKLAEAAETLGKHGLIFLLENEFDCNSGTGAEAAETLAAVQSPHLMLNWDPGNAAARGEVPYPDGYRLLPKNRIGHCHCKDAFPNAKKDGVDWAPVGKGTIDWVGQFQALRQSGYGFAVSLETHWRGAGTPEESTRQSWAGMKSALQKAGALA
jgi:sugar phosphate isomerase/epimerase